MIKLRGEGYCGYLNKGNRTSVSHYLYKKYEANTTISHIVNKTIASYFYLTHKNSCRSRSGKTGACQLYSVFLHCTPQPQRHGLRYISQGKAPVLYNGTELCS